MTDHGITCRYVDHVARGVLNWRCGVCDFRIDLIFVNVAFEKFEFGDNFSSILVFLCGAENQTISAYTTRDETKTTRIQTGNLRNLHYFHPR